MVSGGACVTFILLVVLLGPLLWLARCLLMLNGTFYTKRKAESCLVWWLLQSGWVFVAVQQRVHWLELAWLLLSWSPSSPLFHGCTFISTKRCERLGQHTVKQWCNWVEGSTQYVFWPQLPLILVLNERCCFQQCSLRRGWRKNGGTLSNLSGEFFCGNSCSAGFFTQFQIATDLMCVLMVYSKYPGIPGSLSTTSYFAKFTIM